MKSFLLVLFILLFINICFATIKKPDTIKIVDTYKPSLCKKKSSVGDTISVHYTGKLTNGYKFDSSIGGAPFSFKLGDHKVIKGWELGLLGMCENQKRILTIPPSLAYQNMDLGDIPPSSTLIFEVELIKITR